MQKKNRHIGGLKVSKEKEIKQNCHLVDKHSISEERNLNKWKNKS